MERGSYFSGIVGALWGLTFALGGLGIFVASVGGNNLLRVFLGATAAYSIIGIVCGAWAARSAVLRSRLD